MTHDFGSVGQGQSLNAAFRITNTSHETQIIHHVSASCSCTEPEVSTRVLDPGQSADVRVTFRTGTARGMTAQEVVMLYREAMQVESRYLVLKINADVIPDLIAEPDALTFRRGSPSQQSVRFRSPAGTQVRLTGVRCTHPAFTTSLDPARERVVVVEFASDQSVEVNEYLLFVQTNSASGLPPNI